MLFVLAAAAGCSTASHQGARRVTPPRKDTPAVQIVGTWKPVWIAGFERGFGSTPAVVTFDAAGRWSGSDGCNRLGGTYQVDPSGVFKATLDGVHTLIGCANVPNDDVMRTARRATGGDAELTFQSSDGRDLARYVRVRAASGL
jgi:hypothetical protein